MSNKHNWYPEHFPAGTIVEMANYHVNTETNEIYSCKLDMYPCAPLRVTVTSVVKNGIDSFCIVSDRKAPDFIGGFDTYNFTHIGKIISRGNGPVVWKANDRDTYFEKSQFQNKLLAKGHYYWNDIRLLLPHLMSLIPGGERKMLSDLAILQINQQSFVKKTVLFGSYTVKHCQKKKLRNYIRRNVNRWLLTAKNIEKIAQQESDFLQQAMEDDMLDDRVIPTVTQSINEHGCNQTYLDGEEVCSQCHCAYVNRGPSPLGSGMACMQCRGEDIRESFMHDDDRIENYAPMLSADPTVNASSQIDNDVSFTLNQKANSTY